MTRFIRGLLFALLAALGILSVTAAPAPAGGRVYVIPVREDVMKPLEFIVRRGVKEAMENKADLVILDMDTNGGRVDVTQDIIKILGQYKGATATYVNTKAFSAGAFIAFATQKIYMADSSVIGAAAPIMLGPGGAAEIPDTMEAKMVSGLKALVRTEAEKNGHNVDVVEAMIDRNKELKIGDKVLNEKGNILTLTNREAEQEHGEPPGPLLSAGTLPSIEEVANRMGYGTATIIRVEPTGAERLATFLTALSPLLLIIGAIGIYIEIKTPGFGLPGIIGIAAFVLYFFGSYVAGLAGIEWIAIFLLGLALFILELFVFPGTILLGLSGAALMIVSLFMAMVDLYPGPFQMPTMPQLKRPIANLTIAMVGSAVIMAILAQFLPKTPIFRRLVSESASGVGGIVAAENLQDTYLGLEGVAISPLRPGGKAQIGDRIVDVVTQGLHVAKGARVRVVGRSGHELVVEPQDNVAG